ncbi:MAG: bifunctional oligoribonuclease/PAP phosphatase NrnA [Candidatus Omnitrophica bacterium]|nr:bifunctional oligoribonuclease/PAP phosphatase NrnA [Candidatus Omnitrophota bacterium]MBU1128841.1 bifunctional oligoribonuclease/PAP phosphatase NrnA [Candidatus Omnitrophota bacterium]MBU1852141.1 bifunctional oligoribonuclease/PAP phosphatase NrnA [Candidatus Omnitrophota bacterium]
MNFKDMDVIIKDLKEKDNFIITSHVKPEGDSIGSQLAMLYLLAKIGKKAVIVDQDAVPDNLRFLPGVKNINYELPMGYHPEVVVFLDCPIRERAGSVERCLDEAMVIINIDHHVSNEYYGDVNWVESGMSSVGEMAYHLIKRVGVEMDDAIRRVIYTAIITDTGMFNYDNASGMTHRVVGELIDAGVSPRIMHGEIFEQKPVASIKMLGKVLMTVETEEDSRIAYITLTREMLTEEGLDGVSTEEFINYPRSIKGVEIAVFFNEAMWGPGAVNISFRANGNVDVNRIASLFGGGGHKKAAGCFLKCGMGEAKDKVLAEVRKALGRE